MSASFAISASHVSGLGEHQRLRLRQLAARPALDEVAGDRERPAAEPDDGLLRSELLAHEPHRLEHGRERLLGLGDEEPLDVGERPDRLLDDRADALDELDVDAHRGDRGHDVREHHRRVDAVAADRLERHLGAELGVCATSKNPWRSRSARYSGSERPAWRMNHTGVRSTGSRRAARTRSGAVTGRA